MRESLPEADLLVIDDGSNDETAERAREAGALVASLPFNQGLGAALQTGYLYALRSGYDACAHLEDADRAAILYRKLVPFADHAVVAGRAAALNGPVSLYLGRLALTMSRPGDGVEHLEQALGQTTRMGDRPFAAECMHYRAAALLARGAAGDRELAL